MVDGRGPHRGELGARIAARNSAAVQQKSRQQAQAAMRMTSAQLISAACRGKDPREGQPSAGYSRSVDHCDDSRAAPKKI